MQEIATVGITLLVTIALFFILLGLGARWLGWVLTTLRQLWRALPLPSQYEKPYEWDYDVLYRHIHSVLLTNGRYEGGTWTLKTCDMRDIAFTATKVISWGNIEMEFFQTDREAVEFLIQAEYLNGP